MTHRSRAVVPRIVPVEDLLDNLDDYTVLDVRRLVEYKAGHIPKALPCSFSNFIKLVGLALYPADVEKIAAFLAELGVGDDSRLVIYDSFYGRHAARTAYTLELLGFHDIGLLETTYDEYVKRKHPTSVDNPRPKPKTPLPLNYDGSMLVDRENIAKTIANWDGESAIVDTRAQSDYSFGHIPNSINMPWHLFHKVDGLFNLEAVRKSAAEKNLGVARRIVFYCEEGTSSSFTMYAFRRAGFLNTHTYLASYPDWVCRLNTTK
ncbi:MAG: rhodanese-like domain-containing protein [Candidatus Caldarchaeum sp.]|nr:rhodanese-like domain-containing protein [Candidatus Caldarchaeum sp.]